MSLYFTISLHQKYVLIRGVACLEGGESLLSLHFTISLHQKYVLIRGVASLEGGRVYCHCILLFHCIRYVLIRGVASLEGGESLLSLYFTISLHQKYVLIRGVTSLEGGRVYCHCISLFHYIRNFS